MDLAMEKFNEVKLQAEDFYKKIGSIFCPYLKKSVSFSAKGLDHNRGNKKDLL